jgi:hypothetical protein
MGKYKIMLGSLRFSWGLPNYRCLGILPSFLIVAGWGGEFLALINLGIIGLGGFC